MTQREFTEGNEGKSYVVYFDTSKPPKRTIAIGWNMDANPLPRDIQAYLDKYGHILDEHIDRLFLFSIAQATKDCRKFFPDYDNFSHNRKIALTDFVFQLGYDRAKNFAPTFAHINNGDWEEAARHLQGSLYWKQLGGDPPGTDDGKDERPEKVARLIREG